MDIQVEGNNNRVAGRDYIENKLNLNEEDLRKLATILAARPLTWDDLAPNQLKERLKFYTRERWSGWRGYWLNIPTVLMMLLPVGLGYSLIQGYLSIQNSQLTWMALMITIPFMGGLGLWMNKIRRVEARHIAESQACIDEIQAALRRKRRA